MLPNIPGFLHQAGFLRRRRHPGLFFDTIYTYAWFVGFFLSGAGALICSGHEGHGSCADSLEAIG